MRRNILKTILNIPSILIIFILGIIFFVLNYRAAFLITPPRLLRTQFLLDVAFLSDAPVKQLHSIPFPFSLKANTFLYLTTLLCICRKYPHRDLSSFKTQTLLPSVTKIYQLYSTPILIPCSFSLSVVVLLVQITSLPPELAGLADLLTQLSLRNTD